MPYVFLRLIFSLPLFINRNWQLGIVQRGNRDFRIFIGNGYFDLATPFFATENTIADNGIIPDRVTMHYYPAGHMMYVQPESLAQISADLRQFYQTGSGQ
ncbi:hypothetical protein [Shewanella sp. NFH-SH190041]|uniref:hypothetical protein n=1 Tax=Shewanella sp. NFH-SH190041 TaxID=2950245 RepID=UPI0021C2F885